MDKLKQAGFPQRFVRAAGACALVLGAAAISAPAFAGIATTKHNLGSTGGASNNKVSDTGDICVFCHTPHGADTAAPAPLWNKRLPTSNIYTTYASLQSSTINGQFANDGPGGGSVGSVSIACLSCHDGAQAMDNIINAPGSGLIDATGGGTNGRAYTWTSPGGQVNAQGMLTATSNGLLGSDLSNDHPIGIQYCGGGKTVAAPNAACNDPDFVAPTTGAGPTETIFWVNTTAAGGTAAREKTDMILYNRNFAAGRSPSVECASCHDVHTDVNPTFLRLTNTGSAVCLACHNK